MNFLTILTIGTQVLTAASSAFLTVATGVPYTAPPIRVTIQGKKVELDLKVTLVA